MSAVMRAKMQVTAVTKYQGCEQLKLNAVCKSSAYPEDGSDEDNTFAKFSPSAELNITIAIPHCLASLSRASVSMWISRRLKFKEV